ncbi:hypothetical protein A3Q56_04172 [Intoshia linei]|uniref:Phosphatidylinositol-glycan biosynthesis class W protein n=1 Tax=Intoshia linei TaxID=1819745 RepID=A0A177B1K9_9BILA|nr:hypothetical protein A3Q56_04172 [Intoshia linei]
MLFEYLIIPTNFVIIQDIFNRCVVNAEKRSTRNAVLFFILTTFLQVLLFTYFSDYQSILFFILMAMHVIPLSLRLPKLISLNKKKLQHNYIQILKKCVLALVNIVNLMIFAADFVVFPRKFLKSTSVIGHTYSLMDCGTMYFIFINSIFGIILLESKKFKIKILFKQCTKLLIIGFIRLSITTLSGYSVQVQEYGKHLNFFFILAFVKILCGILNRYITKTIMSMFLCGCSFFFIYEITLYYGVKYFILTDIKRTNFLIANREAIFVLGLIYNLSHYRTLVNGQEYFGVFTICFIMMIPLIIINVYNTLKSETSTDRLMYLKLSHVFLVFLLANVLTGLFNISINTKNLGNIAGVLMITLHYGICKSFQIYLNVK